MKHILLALTMIASSLTIPGCKRDCDNLRGRLFIPLTAETEAWMGDSALLDFAMKDADSTVIDWQASGGGMISWYECEGKPLRRYDIHEKGSTYKVGEKWIKWSVSWCWNL